MGNKELKEKIKSLENLLNFYKFSNKELRKQVKELNNFINK